MSEPTIHLPDWNQSASCPTCGVQQTWDVSPYATCSTISCSACQAPIIVYPPSAALDENMPSAGALFEGVTKEAVFYDHERTSAFIDKMDGQLFALRNIAVVTVSSLIAFAVTEPKVELLAANFVIVPIFFLFEVVYKSFHEDGLRRSIYLEQVIGRALAEGRLEPGYRFGLGQAVVPVSARSVRQIVFSGSRWHIRLLYLLLLLVSALAAIVAG